MHANITNRSLNPQSNANSPSKETGGSVFPPLVVIQRDSPGESLPTPRARNVLSLPGLY